jgi:peptidoglycan hydrolase-like protein with peptidoglycan-binding domain
MTNKKIFIFIIVFILVGILMIGVYFRLNKDKVNAPNSQTPWYQNFNPFGNGQNIPTNPPVNPPEGEIPNSDPNAQNIVLSRFYQITDFAIAGATFLEDIRPIEKSPDENTVPEIQQEVINISPKTLEGRKEIQTILNRELSLNPPLPVLGNFGKLTAKAIKDFQKLKDIPQTGIIDAQTAPYFTKTINTKNTIPEKLTEIVPSVRYVERMNGHIYKMFLDNKNKEKISNSTIPSIYEAFFSKDANTVVYRYLSNDRIINSYIASIGSPKGEFLPQNVSDFSLSLDKNNFFYLTKNSDGVTGIMGGFDKTNRDSVFSSPFSEWSSQWDNNQKIYLTTKPSYVTTGSIFSLDKINKNLQKILGGITGLTTLINPNGSIVLFSTTTNTGPVLSSFNITTNSTKDLDLFGLPEKCVWSKDSVHVYCGVPNTIVGNQYPDTWYQGLVSFDDYFVKVNTITGTKTTYANSLNETPVDVINLFLDKDETLLFFTNKKDSTFWSLKLK